MWQLLDRSISWAVLGSTLEDKRLAKIGLDWTKDKWLSDQTKKKVREADNFEELERGWVLSELNDFQKNPKWLKLGGETVSR